MRSTRVVHEQAVTDEERKSKRMACGFSFAVTLSRTPPRGPAGPVALVNLYCRMEHSKIAKGDRRPFHTYSSRD